MPIQQTQKTAAFAVIPSSHLDLYWLGSYKTCLERGAEVIREFIERCLAESQETFFLETVVFAQYFLEKYPQYRDDFLRLVQEGRLEVSAVYIDRHETLTPAESLIRNIQIGKRWCQTELGMDNRLATHPDLPSLVPQIAQIYSQLGLDYYVTSRKLYQDGQVWRLRSPDGSRLLFLNWPRHYVLPLLSESDAPPEILRRLWIPPLDIESTLRGFPLGVVPLAGSAGDLAGPESFAERYGKSLEEYVQSFRRDHPEYQFRYSIPTKVLSPYLDFPDLPELSGEVPSVWGVTAATDAKFFLCSRLVETHLLTAETLVAFAQFLGLNWRPASADAWQGTFDEQAFFARKDPIPTGKELGELWRMQIFTQDHNAGGQEGALSAFQRRAIQKRLLQYTRQVIDQTLTSMSERLSNQGDCLMIFNPHGRAWSGVLTASLPAAHWQPGSQVVDANGSLLPIQVAQAKDGLVQVALELHALPPVGYQVFGLKQGEVPTVANPLRFHQEPDALHLESDDLQVTIDLQTGSLVRIHDKQRDQDWGGVQVGQLYAIPEAGNDVNLRIPPDAPPSVATVSGVELLDSGPLFAQVLASKQLRKCTVEQIVTLWKRSPRLDLQVHIYWWGEHRQQVRLVLPGSARADLAYGSPFYGTGWEDTIPGAGPYNSDEITLEDQLSYREIHNWLHLRGRNGGLAIVTHHPAFHHGPQGLEAVLLRTPPSCGDGRLFFENSGEQVFQFSLLPCQEDWRAANLPQMADHLLRPPIMQKMHAGGGGSLPDSFSLFEVIGNWAALSSLYPGQAPGEVVARLWDTTGNGGTALLSGPLAERKVFSADLMEQIGKPLRGNPGAWNLPIPGWGIRTVIIKP